MHDEGYGTRAAGARQRVRTTKESSVQSRPARICPCRSMAGHSLGKRAIRVRLPTGALLVFAIMSYAEELCQKALALVLPSGVEVLRNYRPGFLANPATGRNLEIDFFLPAYLVAIEIQGEHHYTDVMQMDRDVLKRARLEELGIVLIETSVTVRPTKLAALLSRHRVPIRSFDSSWLSKEFSDYGWKMRRLYPGAQSLEAPSLKAARARRVERDAQFLTASIISFDGRRGAILSQTRKSLLVRVLGGDGRSVYVKKSRASVVR